MFKTAFISAVFAGYVYARRGFLWEFGTADLAAVNGGLPYEIEVERIRLYGGFA